MAAGSQHSREIPARDTVLKMTSRCRSHICSFGTSQHPPGLSNIRKRSRHDWDHQNVTPSSYWPSTQIKAISPQNILQGYFPLFILMAVNLIKQIWEYRDAIIYLSLRSEDDCFVWTFWLRIEDFCRIQVLLCYGIRMMLNIHSCFPIVKQTCSIWVTDLLICIVATIVASSLVQHCKSHSLSMVMVFFCC